MDCYIYYRADAAAATRIKQLAGVLQAALAMQDIIGELKRRPDAKDGQHTWMEVYRDIPEDFQQHMQAALQNSKLNELIQGARHEEYFMDASACA
jgi:hypothetical protein